MARWRTQGPKEDPDWKDIEFVFRVPTTADLWAIYSRIPILPATELAEAKRVAAGKGKKHRDARSIKQIRDDSKAMVAYSHEQIEFQMEIVERLCIDPILTRETPLNPPEGVCMLREIDPEWIDSVQNSLWALAGFSAATKKKGDKDDDEEEAADELDPSDATREDSQPSG